MPADRLLARLRQTVPEVVERGEREAVLLPRGTPELSTIVREAHRLGAPLVGPGGEPREGAIRVDLQRMTDALAVDDTSHLLHAQAGMSVGAAEAVLRPRGLTLGLEGPVPETPLGR
ncbi:MAG: FAD-binding protein, partial [Polyangiales bacterium]